MALETSAGSALPLGGGLGLALGNGHAYAAAAAGTAVGLSLGTIALVVGGAILLIVGIKKLANNRNR